MNFSRSWGQRTIGFVVEEFAWRSANVNLLEKRDPSLRWGDGMSEVNEQHSKTPSCQRKLASRLLSMNVKLLKLPTGRPTS